MATVIKIKSAQADKLMECAKKVHKASKKLVEYLEDDLFDDEDFDERSMGGSGSGRGNGGFRDPDWDEDEDEDEDEEMNERRGVPGTGRYGRSRYGRRRGRRY